MISLDNILTLFDLAEKARVLANDSPNLFKLLFYLIIILALYGLSEVISYICEWIRHRHTLILNILQTRRQAIAHQHNNHPVDHAFEAHKSQNMEIINKTLLTLPKFDPLRMAADNFTRDLLSTTSFERSEDLCNKFLTKHNKFFGL